MNKGEKSVEIFLTHRTRKWEQMMNAYLFLVGAIIFEVVGTLLLPATQNFSKILPSIALTISYLLSFYFLSFAVNKLPLAIVYASWAGMGILLIAILSYFFYKQALGWQAIVGLLLIVIGVTLVNVYKTQQIYQ